MTLTLENGNGNIAKSKVKGSLPKGIGPFLMILPSLLVLLSSTAAWSIFNCALGRGPSEGARSASKKTTRLSVSIPPSSLVFPSSKRWMVASRDLRWVQGPIAAVALLTRPTLGEPFTPAQPTDCSAIDLPGTHPFPKRAPPINDPSKLARSFALQEQPGSVQTCARERAPPLLKIRLIWCAAFREHKRLTRLIPSILVCALGEQRKLPSPPIHYFAEPSSDRGLRFCPSPEQGRPSIFYVLFLVWAALPEIIGPACSSPSQSPFSLC